MSDRRPARTETFEHAISGLLTKRADLLGEAETLRDRMAEIHNDVEALDRSLRTLGYDGDLNAILPRQKRRAIFGPNELTRAIYDELRAAHEPLTSRQLAQGVLAVKGQDARDRRLMSDHVRRVSKALRVLKGRGDVTSAADRHGNLVWALTP